MTALRKIASLFSMVLLVAPAALGQVSLSRRTSSETTSTDSYALNP